MQLGFVLARFAALAAALVAVAYFTVLERKVLSYAQNRKGPAKAAFAGLGQPFRDALKLLRKAHPLPLIRNSVAFGIAPCGALILALCLWYLLPPAAGSIARWGLLLYFAVVSMHVYATLIAG